jgi:hypothetical protein
LIKTFSAENEQESSLLGNLRIVFSLKETTVILITLALSTAKRVSFERLEKKKWKGRIKSWKMKSR